MLTRLNEETEPHHADADSDLDRYVFRDDVTRTHYRSYLARMYGFIVPLEAALAHTPGPRRADRSAGALEVRDAALRPARARHDAPARSPSCRSASAIPAFKGPAAALGWMYVVERPMLQAAVIRGHLEARLGRRDGHRVGVLSCYAGQAGSAGASSARRWIASAHTPALADRIATAAQRGRSAALSALARSRTSHRTPSATPADRHARVDVVGSDACPTTHALGSMRSAPSSVRSIARSSRSSPSARRSRSRSARSSATPASRRATTARSATSSSARARRRSQHGLTPTLGEELMLALIRGSLTVQEKDMVAASGEGSGRRALVIGGAGHMGRWFVRYLARAGLHRRDRGSDATGRRAMHESPRLAHGRARSRARSSSRRRCRRPRQILEEMAARAAEGHRVRRRLAEEPAAQGPRGAARGRRAA